jgi:acyl-coenzyme A thioesterase PaaI-like protein
MSLFPPLPEGHDLYQWVEVFLKTIPYARVSGMKTTALAKGRASLLLPARPTWNGDVERDRIHTGCLCVLADTACGIAVGTALEEMEPFATLDLRMDYLRSADATRDLICQAHCHRLSRNVAFVRGELRQPGNEEVIAYASATFMRATPNARRPTTAGEAAPRPDHATRPLTSQPAFRQVSAKDLEAAAKSTQPAMPPGRSPYVDHLGVVQHPQTGAGPIFRLPFHPDLVGNPTLPALHGGVLAGFSETAMILHLMATNPGKGDVIPKAVDFSMDYLRSAKAVDTYALGTTIRQGNRVALIQALIWQEDPQRPVAAARGHCLMPQ